MKKLFKRFCVFLSNVLMKIDSRFQSKTLEKWAFKLDEYGNDLKPPTDS